MTSVLSAKLDIGISV